MLLEAGESEFRSWGRLVSMNGTRIVVVSAFKSRAAFKSEFLVLLGSRCYCHVEFGLGWRQENVGSMLCF